MSTSHDSNEQGNDQPWNPPGDTGASPGQSPFGSAGPQDRTGQQDQYGQTGGSGRYGESGSGDQYGQPNNGGQYGQYNQAADSSGYAYPTAGGYGGPAEKGPAPREVMRAYYLILAAGVLYLLSSVISALSTEVPQMAGASLGIGLGIVLAVLFAAIYVVLAVFIRKGQNWARITATVLAALNVLSVLSTILLLPLAAQAAEASGQVIPETPGLAIALSVIVMLLGVAGVVMTYLKPARPYFKQQQLGY